MQRRWSVRTSDPRAREELSRALGLSGLAATVLAARGLDEVEAARAFLAPTLGGLPEPSLIAGMPAAAERVARAVRDHESIWIYTDYDVDGVTSAVLLSQFLAACGGCCQVRLPRRDREGYGLHADALREIADRGGRLVITADCGVTAVEPARVARELGLDLVITDHHTPDGPLPVGAAVVNPKLPGSRYPDPGIAGVGVAWNLAAAVRSRLRDAGHFAGGGEPDLRDWLDLVALGTVADVVPLTGVNRVLVSAGLGRLNDRPRPGVQSLAAVAGVKAPLRAGHIGFQLGPRLNAAGRLEGPQEALDLLAARDTAAAAPLARRLDELNRRRRAEEQGILDAAGRRIDGEGWVPARWSLVVESQGWNPGVIGIVASRLVERHHRPAVVLCVEGETAKGSARSIPGLDLHAALQACTDLLTRFGGHPAAAGLQLPTRRVGELRERFEQVVRARLAPADLVPVLTLDGEVSLPELGLDPVRELSRLEPFGFGNPTPVLLSRGVAVTEVRPMGSQGEHLKLRVAQGGRRYEAVAWRQAQRLAEVQPGQTVDLAHTPQINTWNGLDRLQLVVQGVRPSA